ncbi:V-set domain-containing T-cell activation inhibitor 1-like [Dipodomys spectabilis]|uniref:V-set domain-containing T-cell activation inhibitor 1-like n=1 Tax=Dipodomys spectabilis TaxID=105255 RepID=UPI001C53FDBD|nr:V-set domain-containing T-cell activation inhibitor 1-like [Dipodomys spectabilis]
MSSFFMFANLLILLHGAASVEELRAAPFTDVTLSCHFSFVEGTENLEFSWEREDIREEYLVDNDDDYYRFFRYYDFFEVFTKLVYYFRDNTEQLEDQNSLYEGRVSVDRDEISEGTLSLLLRNVDFLDEAIYKCSAITPDGRGESTIKLIVEDFEMPKVQFDQMDDEDVATCISKGWYFTPNVTWMDRKERDLSNHSTVEVLEEKMNGLFRVFSVLKYPVKLNEIYVCRIAEADENHRPFRVVRKFPKKISWILRLLLRDFNDICSRTFMQWKPAFSYG